MPRLTGKITKTNEPERLIFGWAYLAKDANGKQVTDHSGDEIRTDAQLGAFETEWYDFVLNSREANEMHQGVVKGRVVEAAFLSPEKADAMGVPPGVLPTGAWVGVKVDADTFAKVKDGTLTSFSIEGAGVRG